jgi:signal transduction histidine kinase
MKKNLQFKVSSALKNIVGSDLINDDLIAIFELVKNSYDAHATKVNIEFKDIYSDKAKIIIKDNGKGMNYDDLINKWLFLAYSAKREGTEEDNYDYRDKINIKRAYAGAKGIGRFSCDRLGHELYLETIKDEPNSKVETLLTDWDKFDGDLKDEFININVIHDTINKSNYEIKKGTVLEISNLKSDWNKSDFFNLKSALAKLINPNTQNKKDIFEINLIVEDEIENDNKEQDKNKRVNGKIENLIFETLDLKTTKIVSKVSNSNKKQIETTLFEGGKLVYKIIEKNTHDNLHNLEFVIYFLNRSAKMTFSRRMGLQPIDYGHIFMYKNGLRVYPYGERGEDPLKMDNRKAQGHSRYLGTRETIGYISINNPNDDLRETSSRGDGLIKTKAYVDLTEWFYTTLRRLEKYGIDIIDWGKDLSNDDYIQLDDNEKQNALKELVNNLTKSKNIISFETSPEIFKILDSKQEKSAKTTLSNISKSLESDNFNKEDVLRSIAEVEHKIDNLKNIKEEAEEEAFEKLIENEEISKDLSKEIGKNLFRGAIGGTEKEDLLTLHHSIVHSAGSIQYALNELISSINKDISKELLIENIEDISLEIQKIVSSSRYVTKAGFDQKSEKINENIVQFINEYIANIYQPTNSFIHQDRAIKINLKDVKDIKKYFKFRPFEITVVLDNLFGNSRKAKAKEIDVFWTKNKEFIQLHFRDYGEGIPTEIKDKIYNFGYTNTNGSGMGLYIVKNVLEKYNATIEVNTKLEKGVEFIINFPI